MAIILFALLTALITMVILSRPPVYSSRSTVRIANASPMKMLEPMAWLTADAVEDEMAVLESQTTRSFVADKLHLACKPVPDWSPNPFLYQVRRVWSIIFRTTPPTDYAYLDYPRILSLDIDYARLRGSDLRISVRADGTYSLIRKGSVESTAAIGQPLESNGITIAADGFTADTAQRWKLALTEPERTGTELLKNLSIFRVGARSHTIGVRYQDAHPELAAEVVSTLIEFFMQRDLNITQEVSRESLKFVEDQIESVQAELVQLRTELRSLLDQRGNLLASGSNSGLIDNYLASGIAVGNLRTERGQYTSLLSQLDSDDGFLGYYQPAGGIRRLETDLIDSIMEAELELQTELQTKTDQHPRVIELQDNISKMNADLRQLLDEALAQVDREVRAAEGQRGSFESLLKLTPAATTELERLKAEILIRSETLGTLYSEQQKARLQQIASISTIRLLDPAVPDREHLTPRIVQSVLTAGVFSAFITIALLLGLRVLDTSVRTPADLAARFHAPVLATLNAEGAEGSELELSRLRSRLRQHVTRHQTGLGIVSLQGGNSADNIRKLITQLISDSSELEGGKITILSSSQAGLDGVFDEQLAGSEHLVIAVPPGSRRLAEVASLVDEITSLDKQLAGFVLFRS